MKDENRERHKISHLFYMDDLKIYASTKLGLHHQLKITEKFSEDIQMRFGVNKCKIQSISRGQLNQDLVYETTHQETITALNTDELYKYLGMNQRKTIEHTLIKQQLRNEFNKRVKRVLKTSLNAKNATTAINTYAIAVITYSMGVVKWSNTDLEEMDRWIRVQLTKYRSRHPKSAVERVYIPRKEGGLGLVNLHNMNNRQIKAMRTYFLKKARNSVLHNLICSSDDKYTPLNLKNECNINLTTVQDNSTRKTRSMAEKSAAWKVSCYSSIGGC